MEFVAQCYQFYEISVTILLSLKKKFVICQISATLAPFKIDVPCTLRRPRQPSDKISTVNKISKKKKIPTIFYKKFNSENFSSYKF